MRGHRRLRLPASSRDRVVRNALYLALLLAALAVVGLVALSPLALTILDRTRPTDWGRLSDIGQTYGAVSAVIAALALAGVAGSLVIQSREARAARKSALRALHTELMDKALDDPVYMECWGPYLTESFDRERQFTYINLVVSHWQSVYEIGGEMRDPQLRATAAAVFASQPGRHYWQAARSFWSSTATSSRQRRFCRLLDEAYQQATEQPPSPAPPQPKRSTRGPRRTSGQSRVTLALLCGALMALVVRALIDRSSTRSS